MTSFDANQKPAIVVMPLKCIAQLHRANLGFARTCVNFVDTPLSVLTDGEAGCTQVGLTIQASEK